MKSLKRVLALAVVFAMVLSAMPMAMAATTFSDVSGVEANVVAALNGLGIIDGYEDGTFRPDNTITRGEFAKVICTLIGMGDSASTPRDTVFTDVPASVWSSGYIQTAVDTNGIINGYGDGTFGPEDKVTYEQAVKMIVCALGYQTKAEEEGTYPAGYIFVAKTIGLTDGVTGAVGQEASRMTVAKLLYNALNTPLMQKIVSGTTSSYYGIFDGEEYTPKKTALSEYLGAVKIGGVVENNSISTESLRDDQVQIYISDNYGSRVTAVNSAYYENATITCYVGDTNAKDLLGKKVEAYLTYETSANNDPTVLAIFEGTNEDKKLSIEFDDIREMTPNGNAYAVKYWTDKENNKSTTVYVKADATYYINGEKANSFDTADLAAAVESGSMAPSGTDYTVIDFSLVGRTTGDYDYDYAFVNVYENFVVDSVDAIAEKIYAIEDSPSALSAIEFDEDADYELNLNDVDGNDVAVAELVEYDVLTMKVNPYNWTNTADINAIDAVLVQDSVEGTITEINSADEEYYIGDVAYEIDPAFALNAYLALDDAGTFYLDANKNIVAFDQTSSKNSNYAVIVKAAPTAGVDTGYQVKMYTTEGTMNVYDLADKVRVSSFNGTRTVANSVDDNVAYGLITAPAVCSYKLNAAGEISGLSLQGEETYAATTASAKSAAIVSNVLDFANGSIDAENKEIKAVKAGSTYYMNENTKVIILDSTKIANIGNADTDDFEVYTEADFTADQDFDTVSIFDADANKYAGLIFITDVDTSLDSENIGVAMVKSLNETTNSEGDETSKVAAINAAGAASYIYDSETVATAVNAGELFIPKSLNANGDLKKVLQVTEKDDNGVFVPTEAFLTYYDTLLADRNSDTTYYFGKVDNKRGNQITFTDLLDGGKEATIVLKTSTPVMVYDASRASSNKVTYETAGYMTYSTKLVDGEYPISAKDIASYYVFAREYNGQIVDVVYYCYTVDADIVIEDAEEDLSLEAIEDVIVVEKEEVIAE